ncbi:MAG TPA: hypothetical protein DCR93_27655 [Cytophagales bacterium]|nr:hypothetical protein [Cytophagales bacterium]
MKNIFWSLCSILLLLGATQAYGFQSPPPEPTIVLDDGTAPQCASSDLTFKIDGTTCDAIAFGQIEYRWYASLADVGTTNPQQGFCHTKTLTPGFVTVYATAYNTFTDEESTPASYTLNTLPAPVVTEVSTGIYCVGNPIVFAADLATGCGSNYSINWYYNGTFHSTGYTATIYPTQAGTFAVEARRVANGVEGTGTSQTVTVNPKPQAPIVADAAAAGRYQWVTLSIQNTWGSFTWYDAQGNPVVQDGQNYILGFNGWSLQVYVKDATQSFTVARDGTYCESNRTSVQALLSCEAALTEQDYNASRDQNYVKTYTARVPLSGCLTTQNNASNVTEDIAYMDGFGRALEMVQRQASPTQKDVVAFSAYEAFGRQVQEHLPYPEVSGSGLFRELSSAETSQQSYYNGGDYVAGDGDHAYNFSELENSSRMRSRGGYGPGENWDPNNSNANAISDLLLTNAADEVRWLTLSGATVIDGDLYGDPNNVREYYPAGTLIKVIVEDENSEAEVVGNDTYNNRGKITQYTDNRGRVILRVVKLSENVTSAELTEAKTYYIWDDLNQLRYVVQPKGVEEIENGNNAIDWTDLNDAGFQQKWMFSYTYDARGRMATKHMPGGGEVYMVYDEQDRLILTQDANQRPNNEWQYTKYDNENRPVVTGLWTASQSYTQAAMQTLVNNQIVTGLNNVNVLVGVSASDTDSAFPPSDGSLGTVEPLTYTYYDHYDFLDQAGWETDLAAGVLDKRNNHHTAILGQTTGSKVKILGGTTWLNSVMYYDDRYRATEVITENDLGGYDQVETSYVNAVLANIDQVVTTHSSNQLVADLVTTETFTYDHRNRVTQVTHQIGTNPAVVVEATDYDELSQATQRYLHSEDGGTTWLVDHQMDYDIRGQVTEHRMNRVVDGANLLKIGFERTETDDYNGNIGGLVIDQITSNGAQENVHYAYRYDAASRLLAADEGADGVWSARDVPTIRYDANGNLTRLIRRSGSNGNMDNLNYMYVGNQLKRLGDEGNDNTGFTELPAANGTTAGEYSYDAMGNLTNDRNKGIASVEYNHLLLPERIVMDNGDEVVYTYDAAGIRLRKTVTEGMNTQVTNYAAGKHYVSGTLEFFQTAQGRVVANGTQYTYEYNLTDHLGNVRVVLAEDGTVTQSNQYYPYGMLWDDPAGGTPTNKYLYNGKELTTELGLNWSDFGARFYDPAIGRWHVIDPLADAMRRHSPYNYAFDNPVRFIDPDGMMPVDQENGETGPGDKTAKTITHQVEVNFLDDDGFFYKDDEAASGIIEFDAADPANTINFDQSSAVGVEIKLLEATGMNEAGEFTVKVGVFTAEEGGSTVDNQESNSGQNFGGGANAKVPGTPIGVEVNAGANNSESNGSTVSRSFNSANGAMSTHTLRFKFVDDELVAKSGLSGYSVEGSIETPALNSSEVIKRAVSAGEDGTSWWGRKWGTEGTPEMYMEYRIHPQN